MSLFRAIMPTIWGVPVAFVFQAVCRFSAPSCLQSGGSLSPLFFRRYVAFPRHHAYNLEGPCRLCFSGGMSLFRASMPTIWGVPVAFVFQAVCRFSAPSCLQSGGSLSPLFFRRYVAFPRHHACNRTATNDFVLEIVFLASVI